MTNPIFLTPKQKKFYDVLARHVNEKGEAPTVQEFMRTLKLSSPRAVTQYLEALERKGLIERSRYEARGIRLRNGEFGGGVETVTVPVIASSGCDNVSIFAERLFDEYVCIAKDLLEGWKKDRVVCIRAVGHSMVDAGIADGDYVLVELTEAVSAGDLVVAVVDGFAVIKKIEYANNAIILHPVSSDPKYKPILLNRNFKIFGKVIDVVRSPARGDIEIVPLYEGDSRRER